jgi:hypothetical protein
VIFRAGWSPVTPTFYRVLEVRQTDEGERNTIFKERQRREEMY